MESCATCRKVPDFASPPLQRCSRCRTARYCSRDCQKADWKTHKKICGSGAPSTTTAPSNAPGSSNSNGGSGTTPNAKAVLESLLGNKTSSWLHGRPEAEVFTLLIDSYRMRVEDEYVFTGEIRNDSLYGGGNPTIGFRKFLQKAEKKGGVLPAWWTTAKRDACIAKGNAQDHWSSLHFAVEKADIQEHYGNPSMPMQLRMLAEEILGRNVMEL